MAVIKQGILGGFQKKVGSVVGSSWKGIAVMKSKPVSVANPRTAGQVAQREKMTNVVAFAQSILATVIKPLWDRFATKQSGYNAFCSANIALFANPLPTTPANLVISTGKMAETAITSVDATNGSIIVGLNWTNDAGIGLKLATDVAYGVVYNATNGDISGIFAATTRADEVIEVIMNEAVSTADVLHCYLAFRRADGTIVSNNSYATDTV